MKKQTKSNEQKQLVFAVIATIIFVFAASSQAIGQKFKPGERVECDPSGTGTYLKGTVLPYLEKDNPVFQDDYYLTRVRIEKWNEMYPEGVLCQTKQVRPLKGEAAKSSPQPPKQAEQNETTPGENERTENQTGAKFKPGDRVECDSMGIGKWFKGTVLPFEEKDNPGAEKDKTGKYFYIHRVLEDRDVSTRPKGGFCFTDRMRLLAGVRRWKYRKPPCQSEK